MEYEKVQSKGRSPIANIEQAETATSAVKTVKKMATGKCPIRVKIEEGKMTDVAFKDPCDDYAEALQSITEKLTATGDIELAAEVLDRGRNAMPNKDRVGDNLNIALQSLADSVPQDVTEARLCLQETALYAQGMHYLSCATCSERINQSEFYMKYATKLLRLHIETVEARSKYQRGGEQKVVVQHQYVQVNGGQAIVGQMGSGVNEKANEVPHGHPTNL